MLMKNPLLLLCAALFFLPTLLPAGETLTFYELRTYHANEGKLDALHARFRDHTVALFEKHGMTNLIYWTPLENPENLVIYLLAYPDKSRRDASWQTFREDPEWQAVYKASTANGKLVDRVESVFLELTDYSPVSGFPETGTSLFYEMRRYTTNEGKLDALDARFRDHTIGLFEKHGITNLPYFHLAADEEGVGTTLLYFIAAPSEESRNASFEAFSKDPAWKAAREASEKAGKILVKQGVEALYLQTTDYSPIK